MHCSIGGGGYTARVFYLKIYNFGSWYSDVILKKVELHKMNHRGNVQIAINTPYGKGIVERIKGLPNVRWSQTHRCGYVKKEQDAVNRIYNSLKKYCYVDYSTLKKETSC